jgi:hypothetical protein
MKAYGNNRRINLDKTFACGSKCNTSPAFPVCNVCELVPLLRHFMIKSSQKVVKGFKTGGY